MARRRHDRPRAHFPRRARTVEAMSLVIIDIRTTAVVRRNAEAGDVPIPSHVWEAGQAIREALRVLGTRPPYVSCSAWESKTFHLRVEVLHPSSETGVLAALKAVMAQYPGLFQGDPVLAYRGG